MGDASGTGRLAYAPGNGAVASTLNALMAASQAARVGHSPGCWVMFQNDGTDSSGHWVRMRRGIRPMGQEIARAGDQRGAFQERISSHTASLDRGWSTVIHLPPPSSPRHCPVLA
jgi:hypothetical protein